MAKYFVMIIDIAVIDIIMTNTVLLAHFDDYHLGQLHKHFKLLH